MKIGLFPGSFNPIHNGHLQIAGYMAEHTDIDEVWLVVSPQNPFKEKQELLGEHARLEMVREAVRDMPGVLASNAEFELPRPSYTIQTVRHLQEQRPDDDFVLIIGSDNLESLKYWKDCDELLERCEVYVYPREGSASPGLYHPSMKMVDAPLVTISATGIRERIKREEDVRGLLPERVAKLIASKKYYRNNN